MVTVLQWVWLFFIATKKTFQKPKCESSLAFASYSGILIGAFGIKGTFCPFNLMLGGFWHKTDLLCFWREELDQRGLFRECVSTCSHNFLQHSKHPVTAWNKFRAQRWLLQAVCGFICTWKVNSDYSAVFETKPLHTRAYPGSVAKHPRKLWNFSLK